MYVFISHKTPFPERWQAAFEQVQSIDDADGLGRLAQAPELIFLDFGSFDSKERLIQLQRCTEQACPVVVLSNVPNDEEAMRSMRAGASGYCHSLSAADKLQQVAQVVGSGGYWLGENLLQKILKFSLEHNVARPRSKLHKLQLAKLTEREQMVACEIGKGSSNREIAAALDITERTVKAHLSAVFSKLGLHDRVQLALLMSEKDG